VQPPLPCDLTIVEQTVVYMYVCLEWCLHVCVCVCVCIADLGAAYGTAKSGVGIASMGVTNPDEVMKNIIPVVMAGILGIYGLILGVMINTAIDPAKPYSAFNGYAHLAAGMSCGLSSLAAGFAIGIVGDAGVRAVGQQKSLFASMVIMLIMGEALGLFGMIVGIVVQGNSGEVRTLILRVTDCDYVYYGWFPCLLLSCLCVCVLFSLFSPCVSLSLFSVESNSIHSATRTKVAEYLYPLVAHTVWSPRKITSINNVGCFNKQVGCFFRS
jgi:V-type H+-transporting ATPase proteolipid subunit